MIIKSTLVGSCKVGKSHFLDIVLKRNSPNTYLPTIGVDYSVYIHRKTKLCIWDTSGNDRFCTILRNFILNSDVLICLYKDFKSYDYVHKLIKKMDLNTITKIFFINVGKIDGAFDVENTKIYYLTCDLNDAKSCLDCVKVLIDICSEKKHSSAKKREWCSFWV